MRKITGSLVAGAVLVGAVAAAPAIAHHHKGPAPANAVEVVIQASGEEGFDNNRNDYDSLRDALGAEKLVETVANAEDITVFAPNDRAFFRLAKQLGYEGGYDEAAVFTFLAGATNAGTPDSILDDVLTYHVLPERKSAFRLRVSGPQATLQGGTVNVKFFGRIKDQDPDNRDARLGSPRNVFAGSQVVHTVTQVLRPIDL